MCGSAQSRSRPFPPSAALRTVPGVSTSGDVGRAAVPARAPGAWDWFRLGLIASWLGLLVAGYALGARVTGFDRLEAAVASGAVTSVAVVGDGPGPEGMRTQEVRWRDGLLPRSTSVRVHSPEGDGGSTEGPGARITATDVGRHLQELRPGLRVTRAEPPSAGGEVAGWQVPVWVAGLSLFFALLTLTLLVSGPEPWRATRWAWFWLVALPSPLGIPAFLLLSGPLPGLPPPRRPRRLTGGWALIAALILN